VTARRRMATLWGMRILLVAVMALVVGCSSSEDAAETPESTTQALADAGEAGALPECDGTHLRHVCSAYAATATYRYGTRPTCTGQPYLPVSESAAAFRAEGQAGCVTVGYPAFNGPPHARCCP
jgi:hypothetical protein